MPALVVESMSKLLEILGRAITIDTADLIWHWLDTVGSAAVGEDHAQQQQLAAIIELVATKKADATAEHLRSYLFDYPACICGRLAAAAICLQNNQLANAVEELQCVYRTAPTNTMALYALGHCHERLGSESQAIQFYQDCLKYKNYLQLPRQRLAAIYFKNGQFEKTIAEYELLRDEYPEDIATIVLLGHLYIAAEQFDKAVETFNTAILIHPDSLNSDYDQIDELIETSELDSALEQLEQQLAENPDSAGLLAKNGDVFAMLGATNDAICEYEKALRICPDFLEITIKLGTQYLQNDQPNLAARQFNRAAEINDCIVDAYIGLTIAQKNAAEHSQALTTLSLAAAVAANTPLLFAQTATLQLSAGLSTPGYSDCPPLEDPDSMLKQVIAAHHHQLRHRPQNPDLYYRLGILLGCAGDNNSAINAFRQALEVNPACTRARSKLAVCLYEAGQHKQALDQITDTITMDRPTLELHYRTALLYCDKIKFASSLINLLNALESNFTQTDPTVNIAVVLQNLGLLDRAATMWDNLSETAHFATDSGASFTP